MVTHRSHCEETVLVATEGRGVALRVAECPNCNHLAGAHRLLEGAAESHCGGDGRTGCACPLDRAAVGVAIAVASALVKFG